MYASRHTRYIERMDRSTGALVREGDIPAERRAARDAQRGYSLPDDAVTDGKTRSLYELLDGATFVYHVKRYAGPGPADVEGGPMYDTPDGGVMIVCRYSWSQPDRLPTVFTYESEEASYGDWMID